MAKIAVTGGAGYIGSHVCKALKKAGHEPLCLDNFSHGNRWAVKWGPLFEVDLKQTEHLEEIFLKEKPYAVIHLAGSIHLRESILDPYSHYSNNVAATLSLLKAMVSSKLSKLVFSSSAAVYAASSHVPIKEDHPKNPTSPYGKTKWMVEQILQDFYKAYGLCFISLRYFNAAGADPEGEIGEAHDPETHLIPRAIFVAQKKQKSFTLYTNAHQTPDGTAIRDFTHVTDLSSAHVKAVEHLEWTKAPATFNLGTGSGYSVLSILEHMEKLLQTSIPVQIEKKEVQEPSILVADSTFAYKELGWKPQYSDLNTILQTACKWHTD